MDAAQQTVDTLTVASDSNVIVLDDAPSIASGTGSSIVTDLSLIADFDDLYAAVSVRTSIRASAPSAGGIRYSPWSDWSYWANDRGDRWTDTNANGQYDTGEPYVDVNGNGRFDPPAGCPIRSAPTTTPVGTPCPGDPTRIAAVYPAGTSETYADTNANGVWDAGESFLDIDGDGTWTADLGGHPTGGCWPPGHPCLQPGEQCLGTGS